jgi:hypothetical protein
MSWSDGFEALWIEADPDLRSLLVEIEKHQPGPTELVRRYAILWCLPMLDQIPIDYPKTKELLRAQLAMTLACRHADDIIDETAVDVSESLREFSRAHALALESIGTVSENAAEITDAALDMALQGGRTGDIDARCAQVLAVPNIAPGDINKSGLIQLLRILTLDDDAEDVTVDYPDRNTWAVEIAINSGSPLCDTVLMTIAEEGHRRMMDEWDNVPAEAVWTTRILDYHRNNSLLYLLNEDTEASETNQLDGIDELISAWSDLTHSSNSIDVIKKTGRHGNINQTGEPDCYSGTILSRNHPDFQSAIEPGVRRLVTTLANKWGCVTYTSCEGHRYSDMNMTPTERMVGLIPRTSEEYGSLFKRLRSTVANVNRANSEQGVVVDITAKHLLADIGPTRAIDIVLRRRSGHDWDSYHKCIEPVYTDLVDAFEKHKKSNVYGAADPFRTP